MRTTEDVDFDCNEFLVTFEISSVKNENKPAAVVAFGNAKSGSGRASDAPGFCVEVTQTSVALVDRRTNSTVVTAKNLRLMSPAFRRISILNKPDGSAVFINGSCVAQSDEHVFGGVSAQRFCVGCTPALGRSGDNYDWLKARVRYVSVASAVHEPGAAEIAKADAETHDFFPANALGKSELVFNADFSSDDAAPRLNPRKWRWEYLRGASPRVDGNARIAEFSAGGAVTENDVSFDCSAFLVTFEIASVKNVSPGAGVVLGFSSVTDGNLAETPGFYVKVTTDSVAFESQETRETLVEARGLDLADGVFKRISVLNKPGASAIYVNGRRVALSKNFLAGNSEQRFRIGAVYGRPSRASPESYGNLKARLRDLAVFSGAGTPGVACEASSKKIVRQRPETAPFAIVTDSSPVTAERRFFDGSTELHRACARGDIARVKRLLAAGAVPAGADRISRTPLHWLCQNASVIPLETFTQVAEALIAVDREVPFMCDYAGRAPIHVLCNDGEFAYACALISLDPRQVNFGDRENRTPLHCAVEAADEAFVDFLLQNGADGDAETVAGTTPLEIAFAQHNRTLAGRLLAAGANIGKKNSDGDTLLHRICRSVPEFGDDDFPKILAMLHPNTLGVLRSRDSDGKIPLHYLCAAGEFEFAKALILLDPRQINIPDKKKRTALIFAAGAGDDDFIGFLLAHGADVNVVSAAGNTPLTLAAEKGRFEMIKALLDAGADANAQNRAGFTPFLSLCARSEIPPKDVLVKLIEHGANPRATDRSWRNALHYAAAHGGKTRYIEFLVSLGIDMNARDKDGLMPLDVAKDEGAFALQAFGARSSKD